MLLKARYVVPVDSPVIENGAVRIEAGRIAAVGPSAQVSGQGATDFGDAVICPGFVNAHTHLELTACAEVVPPRPNFIDWLQHLIAVARDRLATADAVDASMRCGIKLSWQAGVTLVGDITSRPDLTRPALADAPLRCVSFGEVIAIGTLRSRIEERLAAALEKSVRSDRLRIGVAPHAPYTVEPWPMRRCAIEADKLSAPIAIHLAETKAENTFTQHGEGPLAEHLQALGVWDNRIPVAQCSAVELANRCGVLGPRTVIGHANYVNDLELRFIARSGASVAYCPRTHHAFGHDPHRFRKMLAAGINVCIGTDSLASNPSLSVLDELRFLHRRYPDIDPLALMRMGTLRGARALGLGDQTGSLAPGNSADLAVFPIEARGAQADWTTILENDAEPRAVLVAGEKNVSG